VLYKKRSQFCHMSTSVLQCVAVSCSELQCVVACCSALYEEILILSHDYACSMFQCIAVCSSAPSLGYVRHDSLIFATGLIRMNDKTHCYTLQQNATHCNALQHPATHCNTLNDKTHSHVRRDSCICAA